jgi:hypothetical protein
MRGRGSRETERPTGDALKTVLTASLVALVLASAAAVVAAASAIPTGPQIGDILVFRQGAQLPSDWEFPAVVQSNDLPIGCTLNPHAMASGGGSLVVEQRLDGKRVYRVHWAGWRTAYDASDCGPAADLLVSRADLQLLTNAVGGPGVEHGTFGRL